MFFKPRLSLPSKTRKNSLNIIPQLLITHALRTNRNLNNRLITHTNHNRLPMLLQQRHNISRWRNRNRHLPTRTQNRTQSPTHHRHQRSLRNENIIIARQFAQILLLTRQSLQITTFNDFVRIRVSSLHRQLTRSHDDNLIRLRSRMRQLDNFLNLPFRSFHINFLNVQNQVYRLVKLLSTRLLLCLLLQHQLSFSCLKASHKPRANEGLLPDYKNIRLASKYIRILAIVKLFLHFARIFPLNRHTHAHTGSQNLFRSVLQTRQQATVGS